MKYPERLKSCRKAVARLREVLQKPRDEITRDSAIQRFEFCFELSWKTIRDFLRERSVLKDTPRDCLKAAFQCGLIPDDPLWIEMLEDRNLTVHTYDEKLARRLYARLPRYLILFTRLLAALDGE